MREKARNGYGQCLIFIMLCTLFLLMSCAAYKHGSDTLTFMSIGWIKVTVGDTARLSGRYASMSHYSYLSELSLLIPHTIPSFHKSKVKNPKRAASG